MVEKNKKVSVSDALWKGHYLINFPIILIFILYIVIIYLVRVFYQWPIQWYLISGFATLGLAWLWWSFWITKWRIWAFTNVRNVHELKAKAIDQKLIWPDYSVFNKTEIRNAKQQQQLKDLEKKFRVHDIILPVEDDESIPNKVEIYNSRALKTFYSILIVGALSVGIYEVIQGDYQLAFLYFIITIVVFWFNKSFLLDTHPKIIFTSDKFIVPNEFEYQWERLLSAMIRTKGIGKDSTFYIELRIKRKGKKRPVIRELNVEQLSESPKRIEFFFKLFKHRANLRSEEEKT